MPQLETKILPQDLQAEQSLLCACLINSKIIPDILQIIGPEDFYREAHSLIFSAMSALHARGSTIDPVTIANELGNKLQHAGGADYITGLVGAASTRTGWKGHSRI